MMIGGQTISGYFVQAVILGQPLFWMWLYDSRFNFKDIYRYLFYLGAEAFTIIVLITGAEIGYYKNHLIVQYVFLTVMAVFLFFQRNGFKEALCLGFLTVFLNSYYWELPLHLAEFLSGVPHIGMLVQLWRLIPIPWFLKRFNFTSHSRYILQLGFGFSSIIMFIKIYLFSYLGIILYAINRLICNLLLVKVIMDAESLSM